MSMPHQIESLLAKVQIVQKKNLISSNNYNHEKLQWKYGTIIFTKSQPNDQFIKHILNGQKTHNLLLTTYPFKISQSIPSLWLQSVQTSKSLQSVQKITQFLIKQNATRNSHLIIKGGGLLMDLGGFSASIYMRGLKNVTLIPTTLLGMVDATVGGKTAVNYSNTKNLLGTIRNPNQIVIHPGFLSAQTQRQFFNGMAQTIKMAIIYDREFFEFLQKLDFKTLRKAQNYHILQKLIKRSLAIKIQVVETDLTEQNERKWLNFGHTIGHGIQLDQSNNLLHGECVAIGMVKALQISIAKGIISQNDSNILQRLKKLLKRLNLPTQIPQVNLNKMIERMMKDKKMSDSKRELIDFVLIQEIGKRCIKPTKISIQQLRIFLGTAVEVSYPYDGNIAPINDLFAFPSSKSISLRYLYMSCLAIYHSSKNISNSNKPLKIKLINFLSSEDTQKMIYSLKQLGFLFNINSIKRQLQILGYEERSQGQLDVGNSGITARFILPLCFMIKGKWKINCHKRMEQRPNAQIFQLCSQHFQGNIKFLNNKSSFPVQITSTGKSLPNKPLIVEGKQSSQFISSAMINWSFLEKEKEIIFKSQQNQSDSSIVSQSYILMTNKCLETFGTKSQLDKKTRTIKIDSKNMQIPTEIYIQNDLSTYSYPYVFYQLHGFRNQLIQAEKYMQGDALFYQYIESFKNKVKSGQKIIKLDFNNCTDTFMTFIVFCCSDQVLNSSIQRVIIENISNQRVKESNRIDLTIRNLNKIGVKVEQYQNRVEMIIKPLEASVFESQDTIIFETHQDHRLAMSFGILSTFLSKRYRNTKFIIDSKKAVQKTFPQFWKYLQQSKVRLNFSSAQDLSQQKLNIVEKSSHTNSCKNFNLNENVVKNSLFIIGNRGSGKTTIGKNASVKMNLGFIDLDDLITNQIKQSFRQPNIQKMVEKYGWSQFRDLQSQILQNTMSSLRYSSNKPFVISTGGGILQRQLNRVAFNRQKANIFYLQRPFNQLKAFSTTNRPVLSDFQTLSKQRQPTYENIAHQILTFPQWLTQEKQTSFAIDSIQKFLGKQTKLQEGYIICLGEEILTFQDSLSQQQRQEVSTFQIRVDKLLAKGLTLKQVRQVISRWRIKYPNNKFILTLRTKSQLGDFTESTKNSYQQMMKNISKIPCDFLDHQITKEPSFVYNYNKIIHSYHGNNQNFIQKLINQQYGFKKFCFMKFFDQQIKNSQNLYQKYNENFVNGICIDLSNPLTRLKTKYQMIIPQKSLINPSATGIMTLKQMKHLKKLFRI